MKELIAKVVKMLRGLLIIEIAQGRFVICSSTGEAKGDIASKLYRKPTDAEVVEKIAEIARGVCAERPS